MCPDSVDNFTYGLMAIVGGNLVKTITGDWGDRHRQKWNLAAFGVYVCVCVKFQQHMHGSNEAICFAHERSEVGNASHCVSGPFISIIGSGEHL